jgi:hypothetical protein
MWHRSDCLIPAFCEGCKGRSFSNPNQCVPIEARASVIWDREVWALLENAEHHVYGNLCADIQTAMVDLHRFRVKGLTYAIKLNAKENIAQRFFTTPKDKSELTSFDIIQIVPKENIT